MKFHLLLLGVLLQASLLYAQSNLITPSLAQAAEAQPEQTFDIYVLLEDRVDVSRALEEWKQKGYSQAERTTFLINALQEKAAQTQPALRQRLSSLPGIQSDDIRSYWIANALFFQATGAAIQDLQQMPGIALIDENWPIRLADEGIDGAPAAAVPNGIEPGLQAIGAPFMWQLGYTGYGRKAMIIDTGEDVDHPAIRNQFLAQTTPVGHAWSGNGEPGYCISNSNAVASHGTHVTGTIVGLDRLNNDTIGVAFNGQWMAGGINLDGCDGFENGNVESTLGNFQWSLNPDGNPFTTQDIPDVINNSWGRGNPPFANCDGYWALTLDVADALYGAGVALVFAAGNDGPGSGTTIAPAFIATDTVRMFSVGAVNGNSGNLPLAGFSSWGPTICQDDGGTLEIKPEVVAPGVSVRSAVINGKYASQNGTSMAAPHAAGALLLLKEAFPYLDGETLMLALFHSADDLGQPGEDNQYGNGMINLEKTYNYLLSKGHTPVPPASTERDIILLDILPNPRFCDEELWIEAWVENAGNAELQQLQVDVQVAGPVSNSFSFNWNGSIPAGERGLVEIDAPIILPPGDYQVNITLKAPNGQADTRPLNNQLYKKIEVSDLSSISLETFPATSICEGASAWLTVSDLDDNGDSIRWYTSLNQQNPVHKGYTFITPPLQNITTYYAERWKHDNAGRSLEDALFGNPSVESFVTSGGLVFEARENLTIRSVKMWAQSEGGALISVSAASGALISFQTVQVQAGENTIPVDITIPASGEYSMVMTNGTPMLKEKLVAKYPYELGNGALRILRGTETEFPILDYPIFYDWEVSYPDDCGRQSITFVPSDQPVIDLGFTAQPGLGLPAFEVAFQQTGGAYQELFWDFGDGNTGTGTNPVHAFDQPGTYQIVLSGITADGCSHTVTDTVEVKISTSTEEALPFVTDPSLQITLFPNPASEELYLLSNQTVIAELYLYDVMGRPVQTFPNQQLGSQNPARLSLSHLPSGMYNLKIWTEGQQMVKKVVVQR